MFVFVNQSSWMRNDAFVYKISLWYIGDSPMNEKLPCIGERFRMRMSYFSSTNSDSRTRTSCEFHVSKNLPCIGERFCMRISHFPLTNSDSRTRTSCDCIGGRLCMRMRHFPVTNTDSWTRPSCESHVSENLPCSGERFGIRIRMSPFPDRDFRVCKCMSLYVYVSMDECRCIHVCEFIYMHTATLIWIHTQIVTMYAHSYTMCRPHTLLRFGRYSYSCIYLYSFVYVYTYTLIHSPDLWRCVGLIHSYDLGDLYIHVHMYTHLFTACQPWHILYMNECTCIHGVDVYMYINSYIRILLHSHEFTLR